MSASDTGADRDPGPDGREVVRQESRPVDGPADLDLAVDVGRVRVHLADAADPASGLPLEVRVEVRHDPAAGGHWGQRIGEVVSFLGDAVAGPDAEPSRNPADAVRAATITWSDGGLTVRSSTELTLRMVPLAVTVWAPSDSRVAARTGAGDVAVAGRAGAATIRTGAGTAQVDDITGNADVTTGSGDVTLGAVSGRARIRTGSGAIAITAVSGATDVKAGSGAVTVGTVEADVAVRTGTGSVELADARAGTVEVTTGSGGLRIGVHAGVLAELDLSSGSGRARSELEVQRTAPAREPALRLRGRTATGDVLVTRAQPGA